MSDEHDRHSRLDPLGESDSGRFCARGGEASTPLHARARFLKNWSWKIVTDGNRRLCERGAAQHGLSSETAEAFSKTWEEFIQKNATLEETIDFLKTAHKTAPFLYFNGNTFGQIGRMLIQGILNSLSPTRLQTLSSATAHYISGLPDFNKTALLNVFKSLTTIHSFKPGERVQTLKGSLTGRVIKNNPDGTITVKVDNAATTIKSLPENLLPQ